MKSPCSLQVELKSRVIGAILGQCRGYIGTMENQNGNSSLGLKAGSWVQDLGGSGSRRDGAAEWQNT